MDQGVNIPIVATVSTPGAEQSANSLKKVNLVAKDTATTFYKLSNQADSTGSKKLVNLLNQLESKKSVITRIMNNDTNFNASTQALKKNGVFDILPTSAKSALQEYSDLEKLVHRKRKPEKLIEGLDETITQVKEIAGLTEDVVNETGKIEENTEDVGDKTDKNTKKQKEFNSAVKNLATAVDLVKKGFNNLELVKLTYLFRSVKRVTSAWIEMVEKAAAYEESLNLYMMSFGRYASQATQWMTRITTALKLDPSDVMQYAGAFNNLLKGMGVTSDAAYTMSTNLTQLTYDMASYLNISNEAAQAKLQSAMAGQSRAVASVGVATQVASLQELAYSLNIKKKVAEMTQGEKTYLRYIQLMRSTTHMQGDLGKTMMTPANAMRTLKNQVNLLGRAIGQVLTPFIMRAIPMIMAMTNVLQKLAESLAQVFGYKITNVDYDLTFEDISDALDDVKDSADDAGKSVKNSLAPFDELNQVISDTSGRGKGGDNDGNIIPQLEKYITGYDMLSKYTGDLVKKAQELEGSAEGILKTIGVIMGTSFVTTAIIKLTQLKSAIDALGIAGIPASLGLIAAGIYVIGLTTRGVMKDIGDMAYKLSFESEDKQNGFVNFMSGVGEYASNLKDASKYYHQLSSEISMGPKKFWYDFNAFVFDANDFILNDIFGIGDSYQEGIENAENERIETLKKAIEAGKTIGSNTDGVWYSLNDVFGNLTVSTDEWTRILTSGSDSLSKYNDELVKFQTNMSTLSASFEESNRQFEMYGYKIQATGSLTKEESEKVKTYIDNMVTSTRDMIQTNTDRSVSIWGDAMKETGSLTENEQKSILKTLMDYGKDQNSELDTAQKNITQAYNNAIKKRGYLTDAEYAYIEEQLQKIRELTDKQMSQTEGDIDYTLRKISAGEKLSAEGVKNFYDSLDKYRAEEEERISRTYTNMVHDVNTKFKEGTKEYELAYQQAIDSRDQAYRTLSDNINTYEKQISTSVAEAYREALYKNDEYSRAWISWFDDRFGPDVTDRFRTLGIKGHSALIDNLFKTGADNAKTFVKKLVGGELSETEVKKALNVTKGTISSILNKNPIPLLSSLVINSATTDPNAPKSSKGFLATVNEFLFGKSKPNANGGTLEKGDYFHMNERGNAEFLGSIGGQQAVVNQDQMVQSLAMVITNAMSNMGFGNNQKGDTIVYIGNKKVYEGQGEYQNRQSDRYGTSTIINV